MNKLAFFLLMFFVTPSFAQRNTVKFQTSELFIFKKQLKFHIPASEINTNILAQQNFMTRDNDYHFDGSVHYTAFFCKMEINFFEKTNVWLKFHAGDYDAYTKKRY